jgi:hypothetical protein
LRRSTCSVSDGDPFGHHGTQCTFETLCERFGIRDAAVQRLARIVHDLDLKATTGREPDGPTVGRLVDGLGLAHADDTALLRSGSTCSRRSTSR